MSMIRLSNCFVKHFHGFKGGVGDFNDPSNISETVDAWTEHLLYYDDGWFAKDKMWCFFALKFALLKTMLKVVVIF